MTAKERAIWTVAVSQMVADAFTAARESEKTWIRCGARQEPASELDMLSTAIKHVNGHACEFANIFPEDSTWEAEAEALAEWSDAHPKDFPLLRKRIRTVPA